MKKGVNIFAILAILLGLIIAGALLVYFLREPASTDIIAGSKQDMFGTSALHLETIDQFSEFAGKGEYECHLGNDRSGGSIYHVPLLGQEAVITYYFDAQGKTTDFEAFYYLNAEIENLDSITPNEVTLEELAALCRDTVGRFCLMFGCDSVPDMYITNQDGTFTLVEDKTSFQSLADGLSYLKFSVRDEQAYLWELSLYANEGLITANLRKYFNVEETLGYVANISLYEEE